MSGKGCVNRGEDNKDRLSPLLSFRGSTVFLDLHNEQRIWEALAREDIYFAEVQGKIVGTGSIRGNEICRLYERCFPGIKGKRNCMKCVEMEREDLE